MTAFCISVDDAVLDDLRERLRRRRPSPPTPTAPAGSAGLPATVLDDLLAHWADGYDWRAEERRLNAYPQQLVDVDGTAVHLVHLPADRPDAPALLISHGWPYTFAEMLPLVDALRGEVHLVVPSLPGFAFSPAPDVPIVETEVARRWHALMTEHLGYRRYLSYGEDVGAWVSDRLAAEHPDAVVGLVASHPSFAARDRGELDDDGRRFFEWLAEEWAGKRGYSELQSTKPDSLAAALNDSPAGLAAWIVERFVDWCDGDAVDVFGRDRLLTTVMLYWVTNSIGTSFRSYFDETTVEVPPAGAVTVPASVLVQRHEREYPRSMAEAAYADLRSFRVLDRGGHFVAAEVPDEVAAAVRGLIAQLPPESLDPRAG